jgi:phosphodiesterase/alkaline phosphatase D-like protein
VADPNRFFSAAHRDNLVGWFPLNEHVDDNLPVVDHSSRASNLSTIGVSATDRLWSDTLGWYLALPPSALLVGDKVRFDGEDFTISFWLNGDDISGTGTSTIFEYGPVSFRLNASNKELSAYVRNTEGNLVLIGRLFPNGWSFVTLRMSATEAVMGLGSADFPVSEVVVSGSFASFEDVSSLVLRGCGIVAMGLRDLRLWSQKKTYDELDQIRDYQPTETQTGWQIGSFLTLNRRDRYGVKILSNGLGEPAVLPAWYRVPRLAWVTRYSSLGLYSGEDRFNEVGLGSGPQLPAQYKLGQQFYNLAAVGQTVVSTQHGIMPGLNALWLNTSVPPTFLRVVHTSSNTFDTFPSTGTSTPWPNAMIQTNPDREEIWVKGDNGYMYKVSLESQGTDSAQLVAEFIARERTDAELLLGGTANWSTLRYSEQPTGAQVILSGTLNSKILLVQGGTVVALAPYSGTVNTPPIYLYLNTRTAADVANAWNTWTERFDDNFGNDQVPPVPALDANGVLEFDNSGTLAPGNYKLTVISGNIGKADEDFDGFSVEISVDATVIQRRLCEGQSGFNFQGTDTFEFPVENGVSGAWQLSFDWTNHFADPNRGEARQLAIHSYKLERLTTELYKVSIPASGTTPALTKLQTFTFDGTTPGGWIAALNSYGSIAGYQHEANVYPSADTLTSKYPLSHLLTGSTEARREDVLGPLTIILVDGTTPSMPSFGTIANAATGMVPMYIWSGGITPESVTIAARMPADSSSVQAVVSENGTLGNPIWSDFAIANVDNSNVAKMTVTGLQPNKHYYYAIATAGSIASSYIGQFNTWDETKLSFQFAVASCCNNNIVTGVNPGVFDTIRNKAPLFFLHSGDMFYNDGANEPSTLAQYQNCYDQVFIKSARQKQFWQELAVLYIWDDHDYGPNDSYGDFANKTMARLGYQRGTPHYPLGAGSGDIPIYYTFSVGRCYFIVTDLRSACDPASKTDSASKTRMGAQQKAWWKAQMLAAKDVYPIIFWVSTVPWGGAASAGADGWAGFTFERRELVDFVVANDIKGVFLLSGDMHACAADNGNNEKWGTGNTGGFVVFQAAPLHQNASRKGTPYSTGPFPASGAAVKNQYGLVTVTDLGGTNTPNVRFQAFDDTSSLDTQIIDVNFYGTHSPVP